MNVENRRKKNGFTLVELLAAVVIVGILSTITIVAVYRSINKANEQKEIESKNNVKIAAQMYMQANRDLLPKNIGDTTSVPIQKLRDANYLKEDVEDSSGKACDMNKSVVRVHKYDQDGYSYFVNLVCGETGSADIDYVPQPDVINFALSDGSKTIEDKDASKQSLTDIRNANFSFTMLGSSDDTTIGIYSYSYSILTKKSTDTDFIEAYTSGVMKGGLQPSLNVKSKKLLEYIDVTNSTQIQIKVVVTNEQGGRKEYVSNISNTSFSDNDKPICGKVYNYAENDNDWVNKNTMGEHYDEFNENGVLNLQKRHSYPTSVSVDCSDGLGSGCTRNTFTKAWPRAAGEDAVEGGAWWSFITLTDNAVNRNGEHKPNSINCYVRVNTDVRSPGVKVTVYNTGSSKKTVKTLEKRDTGEFTPDMLEGTISASDYPEDTVGINEKGERWLLTSSYSDGIVIDVDVTDNLFLYKWVWETNNANIPTGSSNDCITGKASCNFEGREQTATVTQEHAGAGGDNSPSTSGVFATSAQLSYSDSNVNDDTYASNYRQGVTSGKITGLKLSKEGMRYGRLTIYDKAGNYTVIHIYANIDRTAPPVPEAIDFVEIGSFAAGGASRELTYNNIFSIPNIGEASASGDWSKLLNYWTNGNVKTYFTSASQTTNAVDHILTAPELSGWVKYNYTVNQCGTEKKDQNFPVDSSTGKANNTITISCEGQSNIKIRSCDYSGNCSNYSRIRYMGIDKTKPVCNNPNQPKMDFVNARGFNSYGWLKSGESVTYSHYCVDNKGSSASVASGCFEQSPYNLQSFYYNAEINTKDAGANGFKSSNPSENQIHSSSFTVDGQTVSDNTTGGHVIDFAGNVSNECPKHEVKIDYTKPNCSTNITRDGTLSAQGWLGLVNGTGPGKETATVSTTCTDNLSPAPSRGSFMANVKSDCDPSTYHSTLYDYELNVTNAGAMGVGYSGFVYDFAGNESNECPADKTVKIDYTLPQCTTKLTYDVCNPIHQTDSSNIETGWLGRKDACDTSEAKTVSTDPENPTEEEYPAFLPSSATGKVIHYNFVGTGDGEEPGISWDGAMTRAHFAYYLSEALKYRGATSFEAKFDDVTAQTDNWERILTVVNRGYMSGVGGGKFEPDRNITRKEVVQAIVNAVEVQ